MAELRLWDTKRGVEETLLHILPNSSGSVPKLSGPEAERRFLIVKGDEEVRKVC